MRKRRYLVSALYHSLFETPQGIGAVVAGDAGLVEVFLPFGGISREEKESKMAGMYPAARNENPVTKTAAYLLKRYFAGESVKFTVTTDERGFTPFQAAVYEAVRRIPTGTVASYGEVARLIGRPRSARAVGKAMADNPLPVIIPCHRVVGADGSLIGYSGEGGVYAKKWLLEMEQAELAEKTGR